MKRILTAYEKHLISLVLKDVQLGESTIEYALEQIDDVVRGSNRRANEK